jgi:dihydrofolate reductase
MGRKTYESIGKPLSGRHTIIITRNRDYFAEGCLIVHSLHEATDLAEGRGETEVFICGGAEIYAEAIDLADIIYLTVVEADLEADVFFPEFDWRDWRSRDYEFHPVDEKNPYPFTFRVLIRKCDYR